MDERSPPPEDVAELVGRVEEGWRPFRDALDRIPESAFEEPVAGGWTRKQMLAHVAASHDLTAMQMRRFRETGQVPDVPTDEDALNAATAKEAAGRDAQTIVAEVRASYGRLLEEIRMLGDDDLAAADAWPVNVVAGNTHEHYADHLVDLG
jgi:uncharacterized protein (TIGR03083 family)